MLNWRARLAHAMRSAVVVWLAWLTGAGAFAAPRDTAVVASMAPVSATAAAPSAADAVTRFLVEKGLVHGDAGEGRSASEWRDKAGDMVTTALNFLGVRYQRGGTTADTGFDCSGFTRQVFERSLGLVLPRQADEQAKAAGLVEVGKAELQPGDLVFFNTLRRTFSHVGIYVGDSKFVHAPRPGGEVRVEDMRLVYWAKRFTGARRAEPLARQASGDASPDQPVGTATATAFTANTASTASTKRVASVPALH